MEVWESDLQFLGVLSPSPKIYIMRYLCCKESNNGIFAIRLIIAAREIGIGKDDGWNIYHLLVFLIPVFYTNKMLNWGCTKTVPLRSNNGFGTRKYPLWWSTRSWNPEVTLGHQRQRRIHLLVLGPVGDYVCRRLLIEFRKILINFCIEILGNCGFTKYIGFNYR